MEKEQPERHGERLEGSYLRAKGKESSKNEVVKSRGLTDIQKTNLWSAVAGGKLLYSTGSPAWCSLMTSRGGTGVGWEGGSRERGEMCVFM